MSAAMAHGDEFEVVVDNGDMMSSAVSQHQPVVSEDKAQHQVTVGVDSEEEKEIHNNKKISLECLCLVYSRQY